MKKLLLICSLLVLVFLQLGCSQATKEEESSRAALVVDLGDGTQQTACVSFTGEEISGIDLLTQSGLEFEVDTSSGSAAVCSIEGVGCPATDCFCQCNGGENCTFWGYSHQKEGEWVQYEVGASEAIAEAGSVQGWSWGDGSGTTASLPDDVAFTEVCTP